MPAILTVIVLTGSFACTFGVMWALQRLGGFRTPAVQTAGPVPPARRVATVVGPDDDPAFLRELRRRIDLGHFRR